MDPRIRTKISYSRSAILIAALELKKWIIFQMHAPVEQPVVPGGDRFGGHARVPPAAGQPLPAGVPGWAVLPPRGGAAPRAVRAEQRAAGAQSHAHQLAAGFARRRRPIAAAVPLPGTCLQPETWKYTVWKAALWNRNCRNRNFLPSWTGFESGSS